MGQFISIEEDELERVRQIQLDEDFAYATQLQLLELEDTPDTFESAYIDSSSISNANSSPAHTQIPISTGGEKVGKEVWKRYGHPPPMKEKCKICLEDKESSEIFNNTVCSHKFCSICILDHVHGKLQEKVVAINCPEFNCTEHLTPQQCQLILPKQTLEEWYLALVEAGIPNPEKFYCPFQDCSALMWKDVPESTIQTTSSSNGWNLETTSEVTAIKQSECPECRRLFCAQCHVPWHAGFDCYEWKSSEKEKDENMLFKLAKENDWKRCTKCSQIVEKTSGCDHITCRCGYQFCYICGSEWKGLAQPCKCKGW